MSDVSSTKPPRHKQIIPVHPKVEDECNAPVRDPPSLPTDCLPVIPTKPKPRFKKALEYEFGLMSKRVMEIREKTTSEEAFIKDFYAMQDDVRRVMKRNVGLNALVMCPIGSI